MIPSRKERKQVASDTRRLLDASGLSDQIGFLMRFALSAVWEDLTRTLKPFELRPVHYSVMLILDVAPGSRQQEIGEALNIQRSNQVSLIDELETRGILCRKAHPDDRRSNALYLTENGVKLLAKARRAHAVHERTIDALFSKKNRAVLVETLSQLARLDPTAPL